MDPIKKLGDFAAKLSCKVQFQEPMSKHTTFKIGGPVDLFVTVDDTDALQNFLIQASTLGVPCLSLGNGSNMLVSDKGIRGAVIVLGEGFKKVKYLDNGMLECGASASLKLLCSTALEYSLSGAEFLWGIPGSVGGAALMNAGAYDGELSRILKSCKHASLNGALGELTGEELQLSYRHSAYSDNGAVILSAIVALKLGEPEKIRSRMEELLKRRKDKQPLEYPSAGSVFKRPEGNYAGALIEQSGLKGTSVGGATVSEKHAGFIINQGGATCSDVRRLIELIQKTVYKNTGYQLECEVKFIGE